MLLFCQKHNTSSGPEAEAAISQVQLEDNLHLLSVVVSMDTQFDKALHPATQVDRDT